MTKQTTFKKVRLFNVSRELNVAIDTLLQHLEQDGFKDVLAGKGVNASITDEDAYLSLLEAFAQDMETAARVKEKRAARLVEIAGEGVENEEELEEPVAPAPPPVTPSVTPPVVPEVVEPVIVVPPEPEPVVVVAPEPEPVPVVEEAPEPEPVVAEIAPAPAVEPEVDGVEEVEEEEEEEVVEELPPVIDPLAILAPELLPDDEEGLVSARRYKLEGTKVIGKIDLTDVDSAADRKKKKRKRKRKTDAPDADTPAPAVLERAVKEKEKEKEKETPAAKNKKKRKRGPQVDAAEVELSYQETLRTLEQGASRTRQKRRRQKRDDVAAQRQRDMATAEEDSLILRVTEFISTGELAGLMDVSVNEVISTLFASGLMVSINQRLDADTISFVADEFGFQAEFITDFGTDDIDLGVDAAEDLVPRAPVVTVMGHVDHGKTSLLDYIRKANVVSGEAGGITQHIGAYHVDVGDGRKVTFLDTPGHEAFTAMRARGAQVTDVVILVVAADDAVMPQTIEAINHAKAAEVPIVVAINKIDRPDANPPRVMQGLADQGVLVEQYGGKAQCALVSAKTGAGVQELLEKVLLEADLQELRANPTRNAYGVVIESRLEKGRGTVATILVQNGTMRVGDAFVAGIFSGRVRAMFNEWDKRVESIGPALPALVVGFTGAPEVGDQFVVLDEEREAREIAQRRQQIHREQSLRQRKHITLDEIGRRLALGDFQELNLIVKADVGGSVEALSDSLLKLSSEEVAVNIIHRGVGAITESDVMLASASDAVIIGFQVRPDTGARNLAEREEIDIRMYSIIYDAIKDVHDALEGLLSPEESEKITGVAEVREIFKVPKMGTIAGCFISEGRIRRSDRIRLIRDGIVIYDGEISSLRRFKDDVKEVLTGYECGIGMEHYNDIKVGDSFEAYEIVETKRKLSV